MKSQDLAVKKTGKIGKWDWLVFGILAVFCYFSFQQSDILHTGASSFAYLNGHFFDFYDYNVQYVGGNSYLPSTYILFAIWNIPIRLLQLVTVPTLSVSMPVVFWYKLLPTLFYFAAGRVMYRILLELNAEDKLAKLGMFIFLSTPISFFSQFIFGQYDSFTMFFMMLGIYYWIKDDMIKFSVFFSIALTFKYTAFLVFAPLLLLKEKRYLRIILSLVICAALFVLEVAVYYPSEAFRRGVFGFGAVGYITSVALRETNFSVSVVIVLWLLICGVAFFKDTKNRAETYKWGVYLSSLVCFLVFGLCQWHPQWLMFMTPFLVLGMMYHEKSDAFLILDLMLMAAFTLVTVSYWNNHVDQNLFLQGIFSSLLANKDGFPIIMKDLIHAPALIYSCSAFVGLLLIEMIFKHPKFLVEEVSEKMARSAGLIRLRFIGGGVHVYCTGVDLLRNRFCATRYNSHARSRRK